MKSIFSLIIVVAVALLAWFSFSSDKTQPGNQTANHQQASSEQSGANTTSSSDQQNSTTGESVKLQESSDDDPDYDDDDYYDDVKPATEIYKSADEAMSALDKAAVNYDDLVLEQFAELGPNCSWCPELFNRVQQKMLAKDISDDERSFYAEVLAISGNKDNVAYLVDTIKNTQDEDLSDIYTEALEITYGNEEVVSYLGEQLQTDNELLKESVIAALTNHGSRQTIDLLYNETIKAGDSDGFYSLGIGLGEIIPNDDALPYLVDLANKRDQYSHLAVKALLNAGDNGLKSVLDIVSASEDRESNKKLLEDAIDHVPYEDGTEDFLKEFVKNTNNPEAKEFAKEILEDFDDSYSDEEN